MSKFFNLAPSADNPADGELDINGVISSGEWFDDDVTPAQFKQALAGCRNVTVRINSPGGDVMAGAEIYSALLEHRLNGRGRVTVIITALAASAASVVAMAGDEILISPVAYMMIHNPWSFALGDSHDMRHEAKVLDEIREGLITAYERKTGKDREALRKMLDQETWMSATTCVEEGFADGIWGGDIQAAACSVPAMMTGPRADAVRELCARWEAARKPDKATAGAGECSGNTVTIDATGDDPRAIVSCPAGKTEQWNPEDIRTGYPAVKAEDDPEKANTLRAEIAARAQAIADAAQGWFDAEQRLQDYLGDMR